jgi:hypothetical protein
MQPNMPGAGGAVLFLLWLLMTVAIVGGYVIMLVALWRAMKAHELIARAVLDIARHLERPQTTKHDVDRFTFGE